MSWVVRAVAAAVPIFLLTECASGPSAAAKTLCSAVSQIRAKAPDQAIAVATTPTGDRQLDADLQQYLAALRSDDQAEAAAANRALLGRCADLGLAPPSMLNKGSSAGSNR